MGHCGLIVTAHIHHCHAVSLNCTFFSRWLHLVGRCLCIIYLVMHVHCLCSHGRWSGSHNGNKWYENLFHGWVSGVYIPKQSMAYNRESSWSQGGLIITPGTRWLCYHAAPDLWIIIKNRLCLSRDWMMTILSPSRFLLNNGINPLTGALWTQFHAPAVLLTARRREHEWSTL